VTELLSFRKENHRHTFGFNKKTKSKYLHLEGMQNIRGPYRKGKRGRKERILLSDSAHKQVLTFSYSSGFIRGMPAGMEMSF